MRSIRSMWAAAGFTVALTLSIGIAPLSAHHSFALYDMNKSTEIDGTVVKMEWSNPHCWLFIMALAADGSQVSYGFEMTSVGEMSRKGWAKNVLKPGDKVKVKYHPVHDGRPAGYLMTAMTADGRYIGRPPEAQAGPGPGAP